MAGTLVLSMTQELFYAVFSTAAGWIGLLSSTAGLRRITLPQRSEQEVCPLLGEGPGEATLSPERFEELIGRLRAYLAGRKVDFPDKLDLAGVTPFQREVWQVVRRIPYGQTRTYTWVASQIGTPTAVRAVGQALGRNPLPIIIPCHRVLAGDGGPGGFRGGLEMKRFLLALEKTAAAG
jgi:methylated-DNA-[protein]-cysteine S-methyltransferase